MKTSNSFASLSSGTQGQDLETGRLSSQSTMVSETSGTEAATAQKKSKIKTEPPKDCFQAAKRAVIGNPKRTIGTGVVTVLAALGTGLGYGLTHKGGKAENLISSACRDIRLPENTTTLMVSNNPEHPAYCGIGLIDNGKSIQQGSQDAVHFSEVFQGNVNDTNGKPLRLGIVQHEAIWPSTGKPWDGGYANQFGCPIGKDNNVWPSSMPVTAKMGEYNNWDLMYKQENINYNPGGFTNKGEIACTTQNGTVKFADPEITDAEILQVGPDEQGLSVNQLLAKPRKPLNLTAGESTLPVYARYPDSRPGKPICNKGEATYAPQNARKLDCRTDASKRSVSESATHKRPSEKDYIALKNFQS